MIKPVMSMTNMYVVYVCTPKPHHNIKQKANYNMSKVTMIKWMVEKAGKSSVNRIYVVYNTAKLRHRSTCCTNTSTHQKPPDWEFIRVDNHITVGFHTGLAHGLQSAMDFVTGFLWQVRFKWCSDSEKGTLYIVDMEY